MGTRERRPARVSRTARTTSVLLVAMVGSAAAGLAGGSAGYARVLVTCLAVLGVGAALRMWWCNCFESRLGAVVLAATAVVGQVLSVTLGRPGAASASWHPAGLAVVLLGLAVLALVTVDRRVAARTDPAGPPYAL
jgi:hypothetical protein